MKYFKKKINLILFFFLVAININLLNAQKVILEGRVMSINKTPLQNANILAFPENDNNTAFSISDEKGKYKIKLLKNITYNIEISFLGYKKIKFTINLKEKLQKDFILEETSEFLEEIVLESDLAIRIKQDTLIYKTKFFENGKERKLREILKKLPGIEVDKNGNVTVNGKKVDKLLVEGKDFFTGGVKLGVNNIPAQAVKEVVAIDNYSEVPFLKGLSDNNKLALNIKLKKGKKKFVFGDVVSGLDLKNHYLANSNIFYYSPKTNINVIGNVNNVGKKPFSFQDYINFEGGYTKLLDDPVGYQDIINNKFIQTLFDNDFIYNKNNFGAFNIVHQPTSKLSINAFTINNHNKTNSGELSTNNYLNNNNIEYRETNEQGSNFFSLNKINLKYIPNYKEHLISETIFKSSTGNVKNQLNYTSTIDENSIKSTISPDTQEIKQRFDYHKQFSYKHTSSFMFDFKYNKNKDYQSWEFDDATFTSSISLAGNSPFKLNQSIDSEIFKTSITYKHYWVLNNFNHIYPIIGNSIFKHKYKTITKQLTENNSINLINDGFNNNSRFNLNDFYFGFQYKIKLGKLILKSGLIYHHYKWDVSQYSENLKGNSKLQILPEVDLKINIKNSEKIKINYSLNSVFKDGSYFSNRLRFNNFNNLYKGNESIENELFQQFSIQYYKFSLIDRTFLNLGFNYYKTLSAIRNFIEIDDINQINSTFYSKLPENTYSIKGDYSKRINKIKFKINSLINFSDYTRIINQTEQNYKSNKVSYKITSETFFKKFPNFEIGFEQTFSNYYSPNFKNNFLKINPYFSLDYDITDFLNFKSNYNYLSYKNIDNNQFSNFSLANLSFFFNKVDSPWGIEFEINNVFNINSKIENSINQFIIIENRSFIQSRIFLLKLSYKL